MQSLPHHYHASFTSYTGDRLSIDSPGLQSVSVAPPAEFDGPGDQWSPETLLMGAVVSCYALSFRAIAAASKLTWRNLDCAAGGTLDRVDGVTRFTGMSLDVSLTLPGEAREDLAERTLEKAERACLISNSLNCPVKLNFRITQDDST